MEVEVPEPVNVSDLERARFALHEGLAVRVLAMVSLAGAQQALLAHEATHRRVARHRSEAGVFAREGDEVVEVKLKRPARVVPMLLGNRLGESRADARVRAGVTVHLARER